MAGDNCPRCPNCGKRTEAVGPSPQPPSLAVGQPAPLLHCPKCRNLLGPEAAVCSNCGARVAEVPSVDRPRPA